MRSDLFRKIQSMSFESIDKFDRAALITRLTNDITQVQNFTNGLMRIFAKAPILCIGALIMAARLNPHLTVILLVIIPIVGVLIALNMKIGFPLFMKVQKALDRVNGAMREYLSGVRVVKAFNRFDYEVDKFSGTNNEYRARATLAARAMAVFNPAIQLTVNMGVVAVIWLGGIRVEEGNMQVGQIIAFVNYMTQILFSLMTISMVFNMLVRARASAGRIGEVFAEENRMEFPADEPADRAAERMADRLLAGRGAAEPAVEGRIDFENVFFSYAGDPEGTSVLKNVTLTCLPGETVGIIGSTGSGKSSLVNLIPRFYDTVSGTVRINGEDLKQTDPAMLREKVAIVPQKTILFTGSVMDNIRWGKEDATMEEVELAARMAQAHDFVASFPEGYETKLGQGGVNFSGGQKQRVSIARALVRKPQILILDDCTSAVDVATEANIKEALKAYARNLTCLIIAQRITSVMDADKIVVMDQGQIVGLGKHDELLKTCTVYQEIFQSQVGKEMQKHA
jgi:ATP-binding cassette subfamily B protein